jgi:hypothetical protein
VPLLVQLQHQLEGVKKSLAQRGIDLEAAHQQLLHEKDEKVSVAAVYYRACVDTRLCSV